VGGEFVARMGEVRNGYKILVGKSIEYRHCGKRKRVRQDNIKIDVREMGCEM